MRWRRFVDFERRGDREASMSSVIRRTFWNAPACAKTDRYSSNGLDDPTCGIPLRGRLRALERFKDPRWPEDRIGELYDAYSRLRSTLILRVVRRSAHTPDGCPAGARISVFKKFRHGFERYPAIGSFGTDGDRSFRLPLGPFCGDQNRVRSAHALARYRHHLVEDGYRTSTLTAIDLRASSTGRPRSKRATSSDWSSLGSRAFARAQARPGDFHEFFSSDTRPPRYIDRTARSRHRLPTEMTTRGDPRCVWYARRRQGFRRNVHGFRGSEISVVEDVNGLYCEETEDSLFDTMRRLAKRPGDWTIHGRSFVDSPASRRAVLGTDPESHPERDLHGPGGVLMTTHPPLDVDFYWHIEYLCLVAAKGDGDRGGLG